MAALDAGDQRGSCPPARRGSRCRRAARSRRSPRRSSARSSVGPVIGPSVRENGTTISGRAARRKPRAARRRRAGSRCGAPCSGCCRRAACRSAGSVFGPDQVERLATPSSVRMKASARQATMNRPSLSCTVASSSTLDTSAVSTISNGGSVTVSRTASPARRRPRRQSRGVERVLVRPLDRVERPVVVVPDERAVDVELDRLHAALSRGGHLRDDADRAGHAGAAERRGDADASAPRRRPPATRLQPAATTDGERRIRQVIGDATPQAAADAIGRSSTK